MSKFFPEHPVQWVKENPDRVGIHIMRFLFSLLWLGQGLSKLIIRDTDMYADHNGFLGDLNWMMLTNPNSAVVSLLKDTIIPNVTLFLWLVVLTELFIGFSLALGFFSRLGSVVGGLMTISLWVFTLGWDEWLWTYPLIFFPHLLFMLSKPGQEIGVDRYIKGCERSKKVFFVKYFI